MAEHELPVGPVECGLPFSAGAAATAATAAALATTAAGGTSCIWPATYNAHSLCGAGASPAAAICSILCPGCGPSPCGAASRILCRQRNSSGNQPLRSIQCSGPAGTRPGRATAGSQPVCCIHGSCPATGTCCREPMECAAKRPVAAGSGDCTGPSQLLRPAWCRGINGHAALVLSARPGARPDSTGPSGRCTNT